MRRFDAVPLVCGIDDEYTSPLITLIRSLARSHGDAVGDLRLVVLYDRVQQHNLRRIQEVAGGCGLTIDLRPARVRNYRWRVSGWVSSAVYLRLSVADELAEYSRALYLDVDTLVLGDLRPLLSANLVGAPLGAVRDSQNPVLESGIALPCWPKLGLSGTQEYFNSGVMLLDLDACREIALFERAGEFLDKYAANARFWDQDALNWAAADEWARLDRRWNTVALTPLIDRGTFVYYAENVFPLAELVADEEHATILHFAGPDKPWKAHYPAGTLLDLYRTYEPRLSIPVSDHD